MVLGLALGLRVGSNILELRLRPGGGFGKKQKLYRKSFKISKIIICNKTVREFVSWQFLSPKTRACYGDPSHLVRYVAAFHAIPWFRPRGQPSPPLPPYHRVWRRTNNDGTNARRTTDGGQSAIAFCFGWTGTKSSGSRRKRKLTRITTNSGKNKVSQ